MTQDTEQDNQICASVSRQLETIIIGWYQGLGWYNNSFQLE